MRGCPWYSDRGEVDIIGPSEGLVASSILAGRTKFDTCLGSTRLGTPGRQAEMAPTMSAFEAFIVTSAALTRISDTYVRRWLLAN